MSNKRPPNTHPPDADALSRSLRALAIRSSPSSSSSASATSSSTNRKLSPSPRPPLSRRASLDIRAAASTPPPQQQQQLRKRASLASLNMDSTGRTTPMRRRSSLLSLRGEPSSPPELKPEPKLLVLPTQDPYAETTVVLHDSSYKHRYSRPKTSAEELASIVERPERIPAAVLGVCAAQVRAGKERIAIRKTARMGSLADAEVMLVHAHTPLDKGRKAWPEELSTMAAAAKDKLARGVVEVPAGYHQGDLFLCGESLEDLEGCLGALYDGVDAVFGHGPVKKSFVCIRPPGHHCAEREPSGFCWLNNVHIAIAHAAKEHGLSHAVILDFDLHHGDGSQAIAWSLNELAASGSTAHKKTQGLHVPTIGYFSLHDINSYPCEYGDNEKIQRASINLEAHGQMIHNVHLKAYRTQGEFWDLYKDRYSSILRKAEEFLEAAKNSKAKRNREYRGGVFLSAGFDASEHESQGMQRHNVNVPTDFFAKFTADAVALAEEYCDGRVVSVLEGGYSNRALTSGVFAHISGLSCVPPEDATYIPTTMYTTSLSAERKVSWNSDWWALERIEELERLFPKAVTEKRERRTTSFMDPTAASAARIAEAPRRSSSAFHSLSPSRAPSPPKPWEVQAYELSHFFIPQYEESKPIPALEKTKKTASRQSLPAQPSKEMTMTLRERKPRTAAAPAPVVVSKRRTSTVGSVPGSVPGSRAPSRAAGSRTATPALNATTRAGASAPDAKPSTTSTGGTVAGLRKVSGAMKTGKPQMDVDMQQIAGQLANFDLARSSPAPKSQSPPPPPPHLTDAPRITLKIDRQKVAAAEKAHLDKLEADRRQLESKLQQARRRSTSRPPTANGPGAGPRRGFATVLPQPAHPHPHPPHPHPHQPHEDPGSSGQNSMPSSPPMPVIEVNGHVPPEENLYPAYNASQNGNVLGHFHGVVRTASVGKDARDHTFQGGEIRFTQAHSQA